MHERVRWKPSDCASFGVRLVGWLVDAVFFWALWVAGMVWLLEIGSVPAIAGLTKLPASAWGWFALVVVVWRLYDALSVWRWGASVGKWLTGVEVRGPEGRKPSLGRSLWRGLAHLLSWAPVGVGFLLMLWDPQRRTLHDRLARTWVVHSTAVVAADEGAGGIEVPHAERTPEETALVAARLRPSHANWVRAIIEQVEARLDLVASGWRDGRDPTQARSRAFGLLLGRVASTYPDQRDVLARVVNAHRAFDDLDAPDRLAALEELAQDRSRATEWLGPLIDVEDPERLGALVDESLTASEQA